MKSGGGSRPQWGWCPGCPSPSSPSPPPRRVRALPLRSRLLVSMHSAICDRQALRMRHSDQESGLCHQRC